MFAAFILPFTLLTSFIIRFKGTVPLEMQNMGDTKLPRMMSAELGHTDNKANNFERYIG
jgi:hypothetical protein